LAVGDRDAKKAVIEEVCNTYKATVVQSIGHVVLIFRKAKKPNPKLSNLLRQ
jgi:RNA-binding protein